LVSFVAVDEIGSVATVMNCSWDHRGEAGVQPSSEDIMAEEDDRNLPLHDEAQARSKWRGGETIIDKGGDGASGPASEVDNASSGDDAVGTTNSPLIDDLTKRPPD
jgi:hypothetical protein